MVDLLALMPAGAGAALRGGYDVMLRAAPWLYEGIYRTFFQPHRHAFAPSTSPAAALARRGVLREVGAFHPDAVVSTFHLAAQVVGGLRQRGQLDATCTVLVTDFAVHEVWLHPGNDAFICLLPGGAATATQRTRRPAHAAAPLVAPDFRYAAKRTGGDRGGPSRARPRPTGGPGPALHRILGCRRDPRDVCAARRHPRGTCRSPCAGATNGSAAHSRPSQVGGRSAGARTFRR